MNFAVVDDDPDMLALLAAVLERAGHQVRTFRSGREALVEFGRARPDCVIADLLMPGLDGLELCREMRALPGFAETKIIVLSAKPYEFDRRRAREFGADGYLVKPIAPDEVLGAILRIVSDQVAIGYWGVRGTMPVCGPDAARYGGNTPCLSVAVGSEPLTVLDCGTGIKRLSDRLVARQPGRMSARILISHTHWDHINHIPFFAPLYAAGNQIEIYGPHQGDLTIERAVQAQMDSVYFPVTTRDFGAHVSYHSLREETFALGTVRVETMLLKHPGYCLGYRLRARGRSVCYITDNELHPPEHPRHDPHFLKQLTEFVSEADVLVIDATYRDHEYPAKADWGHSGVAQVAALAARAQVKRLHLFHHDPDQTDDDIDLKVADAREHLATLGATIECEAPAEGSQLVL